MIMHSYTYKSKVNVAHFIEGIILTFNVKFNSSCALFLLLFRSD